MKNLRVLMMAAVLLGVCNRARAENPGTVTANGSATLRKTATTMKTSIELSASGKDIREATANLKVKRDDFEKKLSELKPAESKFGEVVVGTGGRMTAQQRQMQIYYQGSRGRQAKPTTNPTVTVSCAATASFALPAGQSEDVMVAAKELEERVKKITSSSADKPTMTPEEQELIEEMAAQAGGAAGHRGDPAISFACSLSDQEFASLHAQAVADAKARAGLLAAAASMHLGGISQLTYGTGQSNVYAQYMEAQRGETVTQTDLKEAVGDQATEVSCSVSVTVSFNLQP